jgi:hypothetical protein
MRYFRLLDDVHVPGRWHLGEVTTSRAEVPDFLAATAPPLGEHAHVAVTHAGKSLDFCLTSFGVPVATRELAKAIASVAEDDLQLVPLTIDGDSRFVVLYARRVVACLDERRSEFTKWSDGDHRRDLSGRFRMVTKLFVDTRRIPPRVNLFRIEGWPIALIISEGVKNVMEAAGCVGARFDEVS